MSKGKDKKKEGEISAGLPEGIPKDVEKNLKALMIALSKHVDIFMKHKRSILIGACSVS